MVIIKSAGRKFGCCSPAGARLRCSELGSYVGVKEVVVARVADHPGHGLANLTNLTNMGSRGSRQGRLKPQS